MLTLMLINDSYLFDAGWLFFAAWSIVVAIVSVMAFGRDLFPRPSLNPAQQKLPLELTKISRPNTLSSNP